SLAIDECAVSPSMFVGQELGYAIACRPTGSMRGAIAKEASFGSIGQGRVPVESLRLWYGWVVVVMGVPCAPTARLCPVPTTPAQSHGRMIATAPPAPD